MITVKAFANYGFAGTDMEFEEEFPDDVTEEEIEETMRELVMQQVCWSWKKIKTDICCPNGKTGQGRTRNLVKKSLE